ncbi:RINT1-like protein MAG2L [Ziziphus jujuba]|uniref:RINT1-like protein MAG2L n=1 Tax=Ziziphus jujuba TaxID=326968 RepID=A0A6P4B5K8_ZIZJJ|nr:RINT1-like protein MAG2L [Ziziphus jujuba]
MDGPCSGSSSSLPKNSELSTEQLRFLDQHFKAPEDLFHGASHHLLTTLLRDCSNLETHILHLHTSLARRTVSWISRSFAAKNSLHNLNLDLQNLSLLTTQHGIGSKKFRRVLGVELPQLAKEVLRIEAIRSYVETTLQLEALVGDLEDAVFCFMNCHTGNMFSAKLSNSSMSTDFGTKHELLLQAIKAMNDIEDVLVDLMRLQPRWCHLLRSVEVRVDKTLTILRPQVSADHRALLFSLGWPPKLSTSKVESGQVSDIPNPLSLMQGEKRKSYSLSFIALCALQHVQTRRELRQLNLLGQKKCKIQLWAIDELVSPIASRMDYHFSKWVDRPEFIFALTYKITRDFIAGIDDVLQPLIDRARLVSYSAKEAWVSAMVQVLSGFLASRILRTLAEKYNDKQMKSEVMPSWLHVIDLILTFDKQMHSLVSLETGHFLTDSERTEGLSRGISVLTIFCDRSDWLKIWAKIELKNAWKKLKTELKDERAWTVDDKYHTGVDLVSESEHYFLSTREDHRAPTIAEFSLKIAWEMIERSQNIPAILPRQQFIRSTAVKFLWYFFKVLLLQCKGIEFSVHDPDDTDLSRVCVLINAARYIKSRLQLWSDDVNFLEMKVAEEDCSSRRKEGSIDDSCFFGEEIRSLSEIETNWLMEIIAVLLREFETLSCEYLQKERHLEQEQEQISAAMDLSISVDFVEALDALRGHLHALRKVLNQHDFLDLWRSVAEGLDHYISCSATIKGIPPDYKWTNQIETDMQALFYVFQPFCVRPEAFFPCIRQNLKLLKMNKEKGKAFEFRK